jgi:hypothetical protein
MRADAENTSGVAIAFLPSRAKDKEQSMKASKTLIAVAVAALIPLGAAVAGDNDQYGSKDKSMSHSSFKKLDANKDGKISQAEAAADSTIVFSTADTNGDGYLDNDEWKASAKSGSSKPQSDSSRPQSESSAPATSDPSMPQGTEPSGQPAPDTETPRQ